jgi:hypothetical protein
MFEVFVSESAYRWLLGGQPQPDVYDGEARTDRSTGEPLWVVDLLRVSVDGSGIESVRCRVPQSGLSGLTGVEVMSDVRLVEGRATAYGSGSRAQLALRARALTPLGK